MTKKILIVAAIDILAIGSFFILYMKPDISSELSMVFVAAGVVIFCVVTGLVLLASRFRETGIAVLLNAFICIIIFYFSWQIWYYFDGRDDNQTWHFRAKGIRYRVSLYNFDNYSIMPADEKDNSIHDLNGRYERIGDRVYLFDDKQKITLTDKEIIGFPVGGDTIKIDTDSYYW